ncbi:hypothetical protein [Psychroserpens sp.]|uniref:hypothetical protein n=1 Tax=Psychroserpens sp. TaxID=2020870 RepID=UPI0039E2C3A6
MIKDLQEDDLTNRVVIDNINNYKSSGCYSESSEIPNGCNIALKEDDFKSIFSLSGFNATEINDLNTLKDFDFVKQTLINKLLNHKNSYKIL